MFVGFVCGHLETITFCKELILYDNIVYTTSVFRSRLLIAVGGGGFRVIYNVIDGCIT